MEHIITTLLGIRPYIVDSENKFTFYEIYVRLIDYEIFIRFTQTRP